METKELRLSNLSGSYIANCNILEYYVTVFIVRHFNISDERIREFVKYFFVNRGSSFSAKVKMFREILYCNHKKQISILDCSVLTENILGNIVKYRNVLAHASLMKCDDIEDDKFRLRWMTDNGFFNKLNPNDNYEVIIDIKTIEDNYKKLDEAIVQLKSLLN